MENKNYNAIEARWVSVTDAQRLLAATADAIGSPFGSRQATEYINEGIGKDHLKIHFVSNCTSDSGDGFWIETQKTPQLIPYLRAAGL